MQAYEFSVEQPLKFEVTGKFQAPTPNWQHEVFPLADYELIVVTEGCLYIADNNGRYVVNPSEHLLLAPTPNNTRYGYHRSDCSFYWLHFSCPHDIILHNHIKFIEQKKDKVMIPIQGVLPSPEKVVILMKQLQDFRRSNYNQTLLNYTVTTLLCAIYNQYIPYEVHHSEVKRQIYNDIIDYVKLTIRKNVKVSDIAAHFGYNEKYLSHLFSNIAGMPLKQYIIQEKIELAKYILTDTNDTIKNIALSLNFTDSHMFMKTFKKVVGLTPSEYRNAFSKRLLFDR